MLETQDLLLDKAKFPDWEPMYRNVCSYPESARYMMWSVTTSEEDAKVRIQKTIEFQKAPFGYELLAIREDVRMNCTLTGICP